MDWIGLHAFAPQLFCQGFHTIVPRVARTVSSHDHLPSRYT